MNRNLEKKRKRLSEIHLRWFAANSTPHVNRSAGSFFGVNLCLAIGLLGMLMFLPLLAVGILKSDELKQTRTAKAEEAQAIFAAADGAKRAPTTEEKNKFDALMAEVDGLTARIDAQLKIEAITKDKPAPAPTAALVQDNKPTATIQFVRHGSLKAFRPETFGGSVEAERQAYRSGKWLQALRGNKRAQEYCQEHGVFSYGTKDVFANEHQVIYNVHEEGVNATGGVIVPAEFENAIIDLREQYGMFRRLAKIVPMASDTKTTPRRTGGLTAYPLAESAAFTESTKGWDNVNLTAKLWGVLAKYSSQLGEDAVISIADDLANEAAYAFATAEDDAGFNGDGTSTYHGIVGILKKFIPFVDVSGTGAVNVTTSTHNLFSEIDGDDIDTLVSALPQYADANARFICSRVCKSLVFDPLLRAGGGNNKSDIAGRMLNSYLGYPIEIAQKMPAGASTDYNNLPMLLFGDMSAAVSMGVRRGVMVQVLNELYAGNGQIGVIASERFDINVHDVGSSTAPGPIVALIGSSS